MSRVRYDSPVTHMVSRAFLVVALAGRLDAGYEPDLDARAIGEAIAIGRSRIEAQRTAFHQRYRLQVNHAPVDYLEVVTPFRRVELEAEAHAKGGDQRWGQRDALQLLAETGGRIELFIELTFHPLNTYVGVPAYDVRLVPGGSTGAPVSPRDVRRVPRFGARVEGTTLPYPGAVAPPAPGSQPMLGGTVIAVFDAAQLMRSGSYDVVLGEAGKELARTRMDLGKLR